MENTTEKQKENDNQKQGQSQGQGNSSEKIVIVQQKGLDVNFILLLIIVVGLVGYIAYQKVENKTKPITKHAIDTRIQQLQIANERIKDVCYCNYTKTTLENKLIVLTQTLDCELTRESHKKIWNKIPWGSAAEKVLFKGNKIQYKVPLDSNKIKVEFNTKTNNIRITTPHVELDYDMVEIQSKPSMIEKEVDGSWLPGGPDVAELDRAIFEEVREAVLDVAERDVNLKNKAKQQAEKVVYDFFYMIMSSYLKENGIGMEVIIP